MRPPCWYNLAASREMILGGMIADIIPTFGSVNMIGGECDGESCLSSCPGWERDFV